MYTVTFLNVYDKVRTEKKGLNFCLPHKFNKKYVFQIRAGKKYLKNSGNNVCSG